MARKKRKVRKEKEAKSKLASRQAARGGFFRRNYSLSWKYIKESKNYIWISVALLVIALAFGFLNHALFGDYIKNLLAGVVKQTEGLNAGQMILFLFGNNVKSSLIGFTAGVAFGIFPIFTLLFNGYVIGFVSYFAAKETGYLTLLSLLPHGIFEIPALLLSLSLGIKFGGWIFAGKNMQKEFIYRLKEGLRVFVFVVVPLLIIAAIIEGLLISFA